MKKLLLFGLTGLTLTGCSNGTAYNELMNTYANVFSCVNGVSSQKEVDICWEIEDNGEFSYERIYGDKSEQKEESSTYKPSGLQDKLDKIEDEFPLCDAILKSVLKSSTAFDNNIKITGDEKNIVSIESEFQRENSEETTLEMFKKHAEDVIKDFQTSTQAKDGMTVVFYMSSAYNDIKLKKTYIINDNIAKEVSSY